jgi:hypothetical protein
LTPISSVPCAKLQLMPGATGSSSSWSGWRSSEYQTQLHRAAVSEYGSRAEAARWVATAKRSAHVPGDAVDIGHFDATAWLSEHGANYGCARSTATNPGTTNCASKPSITVALPCTPTLRTIQGCRSTSTLGHLLLGGVPTIASAALLETSILIVPMCTWSAGRRCRKVVIR